MIKDFVNNDQFEDLLELVKDLSWNGIGRRNGVTEIRTKVETCMTKPAFLELLVQQLPPGWRCYSIRVFEDGYSVILIPTSKTEVGIAPAVQPGLFENVRQASSAAVV